MVAVVFVEDDVASYESVTKHKQSQFQMESTLRCDGNCYLQKQKYTSFNPKYSKSAYFEVVLPELILTVTAPKSMQSGDVVKSELIVQHRPEESKANAYEVLIDFAAPASTWLNRSTIKTSSGLILFPGTPAFKAAHRDGSPLPARLNRDEPTFSLLVDDITLGNKVIVTYEVVVQDTVSSGLDTVSYAKAWWSSLPGFYTKPSQFTVADDEQAVGVPPPVIKSITLVDTSLPLTVKDKHNDTNADVAVGEILTFHLDLELIFGTTLVLLDVFETMLPKGTTYVMRDARVLLMGENMYEKRTAEISWSEGQLNYDLGEIVNSFKAENFDKVSKSIIFEFIVQATQNNVNGDLRTLTAHECYLNCGFKNASIAKNMVSLDTVEPVLVLDKFVVDGSSANIESGDWVKYEYIIKHATASTAAAYDSEFFIAADPAQVIELASVVITTERTGTSTRVYSGKSNGLTVYVDILAVGQTVRVQYRALTLDTALSARKLEQSLSAKWRSHRGVLTGTMPAVEGIRLVGTGGTRDQTAYISEFNFLGLGRFASGDRRDIADAKVTASSVGLLQGICADGSNGFANWVDGDKIKAACSAPQTANFSSEITDAQKFEFRIAGYCLLHVMYTTHSLTHARVRAHTLTHAFAHSLFYSYTDACCLCTCGGHGDGMFAAVVCYVKI